MRFPLPLTLRMVAHVTKHKLLRTPKFPLVLQLEPLHACNLSCTGCGRIREYAATIRQRLSLEDCLASAQECNAPMVSVTGGEPLLYPSIEDLVNGLRRQGRIVYICTNGLILRKTLLSYLASGRFHPLQPILDRLMRSGLISPEDAKVASSGPPTGQPVISPSRWVYWNVHVDGLETTHDRAVERPGVFRECVLGVRMAKALGYQVATNTTVYRESDMAEIEQMLDLFSTLGVDGHTISPGYDYDAVKRDLVERQNRKPEEFFLTRRTTREKFARIEEWGRRYNLLGTPIYQEFLAGKRELTCTPWAIPTRNILGWKAPCYLMTEAHYPTYREMLGKVEWTRYGVVDGVPRDPRCENCMVHCGYDPSGALGVNYQPGDLWKNLRYQFGPRPRRDSNGSPDSNPR